MWQTREAKRSRKPSLRLKCRLVPDVPAEFGWPELRTMPLRLSARARDAYRGIALRRGLLSPTVDRNRASGESRSRFNQGKAKWAGPSGPLGTPTSSEVV
eukprot:5857343-Alexandrium_andersonii.AAC.1